MTDRDTFAAAALTGLLAAPTDKDRSSEYWARFSYEIADAILRERGNHSAKPDSSALTDAEREAVDTAEASLMRESTDLNTPLPVRQRLGSAAATLRGLLERLG